MAGGSLRVLQLNAGSLLEPGWDARRHEVVAWIDRLAPDVVCLQEVWEDATHENTARWIADACAGDWDVGFGGAAFAPEVWPDESMRFGSAVLSRWSIDSVEHVRLPIVGDDDDPTPAQVPWELVHVRTAGLDVVSVHLAAAPTHGRHRVAQVVAIDDHVRRARGDRDAFAGIGRRRDGMPAILCGDFNAEPDSDEIRFLCGFTAVDGRTTFWQDAWRVAGDGPGYTQDWRANSIAAAMNVNRKRIDYVFVGDGFMRQGSAGRIIGIELACHEPITGVHASDHHGLVVDLVWPDGPPEAAGRPC